MDTAGREREETTGRDAVGEIRGSRSKQPREVEQHRLRRNQLYNKDMMDGTAINDSLRRQHWRYDGE